MNRRLLCFFVVLVLALQTPLRPLRAQLATSFYSVTGIETKTLPNAVQVTIRTDGAVKFGGDLRDWIDIGENTFEPRRISSLRLRLVRARSRLPAFVDIGAYPVDSAQISLGRSVFELPYFPEDADEQPEPRVDIELRFFVPILIRQFIVERFSGYDNDISFGEYLRPLDVRIEPGEDRRSIVITVITDRTDVRGAAALRRSPPEAWKHRLNVQARAVGRARLDVLHQPLGKVLSEASPVLGAALSAREGAGDIDVSLWLPDADTVELLNALERGYGLTVERDHRQPNAWTIGRGGAGMESQRIALRHLTPSRARLLFPDFLLPSLRADNENNGLVATGPRVLIERIRRDVERLDRPRALVRVEASVYEIARNDDWNFAFQAAYGGPVAGGTATSGLALDSSGQIALRVEPGTSPDIRLRLEALRVRGRANLRARPSVTVLSGESGTLFLGQTRFVPVLRSSGGRQEVRALPISIGYSLTVRPISGAPTEASDAVGKIGGEVVLDVSPRVSTIDDIERGTGLPTLGIREISSTLRLRDGDELIIAGLDSLLDSQFRSRRLPSRRDNRSDTQLIVLVTARRV